MLPLGRNTKRHLYRFYVFNTRPLALPKIEVFERNEPQFGVRADCRRQADKPFCIFFIFNFVHAHKREYTLRYVATVRYYCKDLIKFPFTNNHPECRGYILQTLPSTLMVIYIIRHRRAYNEKDETYVRNFRHGNVWCFCVLYYLHKFVVIWTY